MSNHVMAYAQTLDEIVKRFVFRACHGAPEWAGATRFGYNVRRDDIGGAMSYFNLAATCSFFALASSSWLSKTAILAFISAYEHGHHSQPKAACKSNTKDVRFS